MMGKRSRSKPRPKSGTAASAHDGAAVKEQMIDDRDGQFENDVAETADELPSQSYNRPRRLGGHDPRAKGQWDLPRQTPK